MSRCTYHHNCVRHFHFHCVCHRHDRGFVVAAYSELPNEQVLSRSLPLNLQGSLWLLLSLTRSLACIRCSSRRLPVMLPERHRHPPSLARACLPATSTVMMSLSSRSKGVSLAWGGSMPRHKLQVSHHGAFVGCAFRFCRCVGFLHGLWYGWVYCTLQVTSSSVQQSSFQVSTFKHFSPGRDATSVFLSSTLVLVTLAIAFSHVLGEELSKYRAEDPRREAWCGRA